MISRARHQYFLPFGKRCAAFHLSPFPKRSLRRKTFVSAIARTEKGQLPIFPYFPDFILNQIQKVQFTILNLFLVLYFQPLCLKKMIFPTQISVCTYGCMYTHTLPHVHENKILLQKV